MSYTPAYPKPEDDSFPWLATGAGAVGLGALAATPMGFRSALGLSHGLAAIPGGGAAGAAIEGAARGARGLGEVGQGLAADVGAGVRRGMGVADEAMAAQAAKQLNRGLANTESFLANLAKKPGSTGDPRAVNKNLNDLFGAAKSEALAPEQRLQAISTLENLATQWWSKQPKSIQHQHPLDIKEIVKLRDQITKASGGPSPRDAIP